MASGRRQYPFHLIEPKWQRLWDAQETFRSWNPGERPTKDHPFAQRHANIAPDQLRKFYILDMFPYPSGAGLHVGHPEGYTATDMLARYRRALGFHVLHPMGWDAFGLPAEQYAIETGTHPSTTTRRNIATFKRQIQALGFSYDWSREINTTDPDYFKWTQWIFLQIFNSWFNPATSKAEPIETLPYPPELERATGGSAGELEAKRRAYRDSKRLAYQAEVPVWWCEGCKAVLANEEVRADGTCDRKGHAEVYRRPLRQWILRITAYAERLLNDLARVDWSAAIKEMQRNWIGRSEGAEVDFAVVGSSRREDRTAKRAVPAETIHVFTTRPDTLFGATYMVLAPEHPLVGKVTAPEERAAVEAYCAETARKSELERAELEQEKTGVFTGGYAINPVNDECIPIWIADYVLPGYGTGAIMAVPGHDTRDLEFARKFDLPIRVVVQAPEGQDSVGFVGDGVSVDSGLITGLPTPEAKKKITAWLEERRLGKAAVNYKLRDWLFSRQRYWGEPIPVIHCARCGTVPVPEKRLPLGLPEMTDYTPTGSAEPPLAKATDWVNTDCPECGGPAKRETNTMPQWAGSCWYYLRYLDPKNDRAFCGREAERYWLGTKSPHCPSSLQDLEHEIDRLVDLAIRQPGSPRRRVILGPVTKEEAETIRQTAKLDLGEAFHVLDNYAVRHTLKSHGVAAEEEVRGQQAVTREHFHLLPAVVLLPDKIESLGKNVRGLELLRFTRRIDGVVCVVEELRIARQMLAVVTMCVKGATASDTAIGAPLSTAETDRRAINLILQQCAVNTPSPGVDLYVGGAEHAVLHLLYSRFWHKVLFDLGHVSAPEPFYKLVNQGLILGEDGQKMSKSRGNVVNPDDILAEFGADAFRLYEMFLGPLEMVKPWSTKGVEGVYRFLGRVWRLFVDEQSETEFEQSVTAESNRGAEFLERIQLSPAIKDAEATPAQLKALHACIRKVTDDLDGMRFNTAISAMMVFVNEAITWVTKPACVMREFLVLLQPFAPHLAEELHAKLAAKLVIDSQQSATTLAYHPWPAFDPAQLVEDTLEIPVQVNGKLRDRLVVPADATQRDLETAALASEKVKPFLDGKQIKKIIVVPGKLVNIALGS